MSEITLRQLKELLNKMPDETLDQFEAEILERGSGNFSDMWHPICQYNFRIVSKFKDQS